MSKTAPFENVHLQPSTKGMISNASQYVVDSDSWSYLENFNDDTAGCITTRPYVRQSFTTTNGYQGIGFSEGAGGNTVVMKSGTDFIYFQPDSPTTFGTTAGFFAYANSVARFSPIQDSLVVASPGMFPKVISNAGIVQNVLSMPSNIGIVLAGFAGRIWGVPTFSSSSPTRKTDEIYYTDVLPQDVSTTVITGGSEFLKINTKGRAITALVEENNAMYVFTNESIFRVYNTQSQDNAPIANVGTFRQESVVRTPGGVFFLGNSGIYRLGDTPEKVSEAIDDFFQKLNILRSDYNITSGYPKNVWGWSDNNSVYFAVERDAQYGTSISGNISFPDRTFVIKYNFIRGTCAIYSYYNMNITCAASYNFATNLNNEPVGINPFVVIAGKDLSGLQFRVGYVPKTYYRNEKPLQAPTGSVALDGLGDWSCGVTTETNAQPIFCHAETQWLTFDMENKSKKVTGISVASENAAGFKLYYQIDKDGLNHMFDNGKWEEIGSIKDSYMTFFRSFNSQAFFRIKFAIAGQATSKPIKIGQISLLKVEDKGYGQ